MALSKSRGPRLKMRLNPRDVKNLKKVNDQLAFAVATRYPARVKAVAESTLRLVKNKTPKDTGATASAWFLDDKRKSKGRGVQTFVIDSDLARTKKGRMLLNVLEFGHKGPYTIRPRKKGMLSWVDKKSGLRVSAWIVHREGNKPFAMLRISRAVAEIMLRQEFMAIAEDAARTWKV